MFGLSLFIIFVSLAALSFFNPRAGISVFILAFPFFPIYVLVPIWGNVVLNGIEMLSLALLLPIFVLQLLRGMRLFRNALDTLFFLFVIFQVLVQMINPTAQTATGLQAILHTFLVPFVLYYTVSRFVATREDFTDFVKLLIVGSIPFILLGYYEQMTGTNVFLHLPFMDNDSARYWGVEDFRDNILRIKTSFAQPLSYATYLSAMTMIVLVSSREFPASESRTSKYLMALAMLPLFLFAQARGAMLITFLLVFVYYVSRTRPKYFVPISVLLATMFIVFLVLVPQTVLLISTSSASLGTFVGRVNLWSTALGALSHVSLFGVADIAQVAWLPKEMKVDIVSWYLESLVFRGLIFFLLHLVFVGFIVVNTVSLIRRDRFNMIVGMAIFAFLLNYVNVSFIGTSPVFFWIVLALLSSSISVTQVKNPVFAGDVDHIVPGNTFHK